MHIGRSPLNIRTQGTLRTIFSTELPAWARREADATPFTLLGTVNVPRVLGYPSLPAPKPCSTWPCSRIFLAVILPPRPKMEGWLPGTPFGTVKD